MHLVSKIFLYWYTLVFLTTELLSFFHLLERNYVVIINLVFCFVLILNYKKSIFGFFKILIHQYKSFTFLYLITFLTFIQGLYSAPNTTDSMVYHLTRVMYWLQEKTVHQQAIFNPHDFKAPFGEYILTHLYLITNNDRLVFLSQWFAFIGSIVLVGIIADQLGANKKTKNIIRLLCATLPIVALQASSTQVDLVVAFLILIALNISLSFIDKPDIKKSIFLGLAIGIGVLTKATFLIFLMVPLGLVGLVALKKNWKYKLLLVLSLLFAFVIQIRFISQNLSLYNSVLGQHIKSDGSVLIYSNEDFTVISILSNFIRNIFTQLPFPLVAPFVQSGLTYLHQILGQDINDPRTTICCSVEFKVPSVIFPQEDIAANPLHLLLIGITTLVLVVSRKFNSIIFLLFIFNIFSYFVFSAYLKWQPFHSRLEIPFFMMGTILSVLFLSGYKFGKKVVYTILPLSVAFSLILIVLNVSRPFVSYKYFISLIKPYTTEYNSVPEAFYSKPRIYQYFNSFPFWYNPYVKVVENLEANSEEYQISFDLMNAYEFEYPFWILLKEKGVRFKAKPITVTSEPAIIISTSKDKYTKEGYESLCYKTTIEYGYACYNKKII